MEDFFVNETVFFFESGLFKTDVVLQAINDEEVHVFAVENDDKKVRNGFHCFTISESYYSMS